MRWLPILLALELVVLGCEAPSFEGDPYGSSPLPHRGTRDDSSNADESPSTAGALQDAGSRTDAGRDASGDAVAPTVTQTFAIGSSDCGGGHCGGGYDGEKDPKQITTASKQCSDRGFARAIDFTIGDQPGGQFCSWNGASYGCDMSCSGCNTMTTVMCAKP